MFAGSRFCPRCGAEATREQVDDGVTLSCPRCDEPLQGLKLGATTVHECGACGGLWMAPDALQRLCDAREEHAGVVATLAAHAPTATASPDTVRYIPCPRCRKLMNRVNFAHSSGVVMDVCKTDGVWLDRGELQRIVDFVEHGGLETAREHEKEQLADERRRLDAARAASAASAASLSDLQSAAIGARLRTTADTPVERLFQDALGLFLRP